MPIISNPLDLLFQNLFFETSGLIETARLVVKLEGYNVTGSIKIKPALFMIDDPERRGLLEPHRSTIVESSSGNLGIALALICSLRGYGFICVTDPNISSTNRRGIEAYGGCVVVVDRRDRRGGYLETRLACIRDLLAEHRDYVWLNQYANPANMRAHAELTALEILSEFPKVSHLYVGSGTTGTIMGLAQRFAELSPDTEVVAVEPEGSVTFDPSRTGRRLIPGIGTSRRPELADAKLLDRIVYVSEIDAIAMCHRLARRHGLLLGGSTGSVLAAVAADAARFGPDSLVMAISPDLGDKYLDSVFAPEWVKSSYGVATATFNDEAAVVPCEPLREVVARHTPRQPAAARRRRTFNGHGERPSAPSSSRAG
jgi:N-(2-amino-2-carboxyethyl)-L-glutamate synthase